MLYFCTYWYYLDILFPKNMLVEFCNQLKNINQLYASFVFVYLNEVVFLAVFFLDDLEA